jgi:hypothetical protein
MADCVPFSRCLVAFRLTHVSMSKDSCLNSVK